MHRTQNLLAALFICLIPFQNTILQNSILMTLGSSFAIMPLLVMVLMSMTFGIPNWDLRVHKSICIGILYCFLASLFGVLKFGLYSQGVNLIWQASKFLIDTTLALYVIFAIDYKNNPWVGTSIKVAFTITVAGIMLGDIGVFGLKSLIDNEVLRFLPSLDGRWQGTTKESSHLSVLIVTFGMLSAHVCKSRTGKVFSWVNSFLWLALSGSKGGFLTMVLTLAIVLFRGKLGLLKATVFSLLASIPIAIGLIMFLPQLNTNVLGSATSLATRLTLFFWTTHMLMYFPLGVGFTGFLPAMKAYIAASAEKAQALIPFPMNFSEVLGYRDSAQDASTKTLLGNFSVFFGVPFLYFAGKFVSRLIRNLIRERQTALVVGIFFVVIAFSTYYDSLANYNTFLLIGIATNEYGNSVNTSSYA